MKEIILARDTRLALRAQAHHLDPVVLLGANGLTDAVLAEIDRELKAHELIKVRVPIDEREERATLFQEVAEKLGAARVQMIGKLLIFWRPEEGVDQKKAEAAARLAILSAGKGSVSGKKAPSDKPVRESKKAFVAGTAKKKIASKKPGEKKAKAQPVPRRARPKHSRVTKKAALAKA